MFKTIFAACAWLAAAALTGAAMAEDGLITKKSAFSYDETLAKLEAALASRNITVMNKINHAAGAANAGIELRPTILVIFGNPQVGSQLMAASQTMGLDLPLKAVVFEDANGDVHVTYNDIRHLAARHGVDLEHPAVGRISGGLEVVSNAATSP